MGVPLLHAGNQILCAHGGSGEPVFSNIRVSTHGNYFLTAIDPVPFSGCLNTQPPGVCVIGQYAMPATRVRICGQPALLSSSMATCTPTGTPAVTAPAPPVSFVGGM